MVKIKLYPCFKHWLEYNNIFLISDMHFSDPEMVHLRKNYISDEEQVKRINSKVGKKDLLICLGDCGDLSFVSQLKAGYKVLIKGNHDDKGDDFYKRVRNEIKTLDSSKLTEEDKEKLKHVTYQCSGIKYGGYDPDKKILDEVAAHLWTTRIEDNHLFDEVYSGPVWINEKVLLSHEPIDLPYVFNIHGHDHSNWFDNGHHLNLCVEHIDYTPVSLVKLIKDGTFSKVDSIHRMTIDKATEKKLKRSE